MSAQHKNLTATQLHEPKGISAASLGNFNYSDTSVNSWVDPHYEEVVTASVSSTISFDNLDDFREIKLIFNDLISSVPARFHIRVSSDNGSTYLSTSIYYVAYNNDNTSESSSVHTYLSPHSDSNVYVNGTLIFSNFNKALVTNVKGQMAVNSTSLKTGTGSNENIIGSINSATAWNALIITPFSGTLTSGTVSLEGTRS